jgi:uncharacterized protein YecE (DUF72 family)
MLLRLGTAGYAYPEWVGGLYPRGTTQNDMLSAYAAQFAAVEINSSFYRPPTPEQVEKMARRTPAGFRFTFKVPRSVSHDCALDDLPAFKEAADCMASAGKLLGLILQVPEAFRNTADNRAWITRVGSALKPHRVAVEFRHRSWDASNLPEWMAHIRMDLVSVGVPDVPTLFPRGLRVANRRIYARLHSQNADNWYRDSKLRYNYDYPDAALKEWADGLKRAAELNRADEALVVFNNCVGSQLSSLHPTNERDEGAFGSVRMVPDSAVNAWKLAAMLRESPAVRVVDPAPPNSLSLFD